MCHESDIKLIRTDTPVYEQKPIYWRTPAWRLEKGTEALKRAGEFLVVADVNYSMGMNRQANP